jgi:acyl-CoA thioester hydrolase
MTHSLRIKIYYEDTDCGGVVYYANYLRYFERARTELLESRGVSLKKLMDEGVYFVVTDVVLKYTAPGRYGDFLSVETSIEGTGPASILFGHRVTRDSDGAQLVTGSVKIVCVGEDLKPVRLSHDIIETMRE